VGANLRQGLFAVFNQASKAKWENGKMNFREKILFARCLLRADRCHP